MPLLTRSGLELHYELTGFGAPVVLIQGVGAAGSAWRPQAEGLQLEFQTLLFDNRGLGRSALGTDPLSIEAMAEDVRALMDEVGWTTAHVVGHSMGGVIAQQFALSHPGRVRSLSLLCTFSRGAEAARLTPWVLWFTLRTRVGTRRMRRRAFLGLLMTRECLREADRDALAAQVSTLLGRDLADQPPVVMRQLSALRRHDVFARLGALAPIPTLVVSARQDRIALSTYGRDLARAIPGATFEEMPAAHGVTIEKAEHVNQRLRAFFHSVDRTGGV